MPAGTDLPRFDALTVGNNTPGERRRAALTTANHARGKADCRELLAMLGLLPEPRTRAHGMTGYRSGCRCKQCRHANAERNRRHRANRPHTYLTEEQWQAQKEATS